MKKLILIFVALASTHSFAGTCANTDGLYADYPKIPFGSVFVSIDGVCVKGDTLYTRSAIDVCAEWNGTDADTCSKYESKILSTSIIYSKDIPINDTEFETIQGKHPLSYSVPFGTFGDGFNSVCEMNYAIPACK